jgi:ATP adenylyltransferase
MGCRYCDNILSISPGRNLEVYDRILCESKNFVAVPTIGSLVEGWVLVVSKEHHVRMACLGDDQLEELNHFKSDLVRVVADYYGPVAIFEHGPSRPMQAVGCGVDHAHLHIVPTDCDLIRGLHDITDHELEWAKVSGVLELRSYRDSEKEYLFVEQPVGDGRVATSPRFGSQLFRRVVANHIGFPSRYDWKSYVGAENAIKTAERLAPRFVLSSPIQAAFG